MIASEALDRHEHTSRQADLSAIPDNPPWLVIGWYTPDYEPWASRFADSLRACRAPHELQCVERSGGWEETTRLKPKILLGFMDKFRRQTLILSDVDATATGDLTPLADLDCDVALNLAAKRLRGRHMIVARSGTMVLQPTSRTVALVETWVRLQRIRVMATQTKAASRLRSLQSMAFAS